MSRGLEKNIAKIMSNLQPIPSIQLCTTFQCTSRCSYCSRRRQWGNPATMSVQYAMTIIETMSPLGLTELRISGGEPTLNHLTFLNIIDYAYERRILVKLDTNGAWASPFRHYTSFEIASKVCNSLMRRGVYSICLSADYEHLKFIDGQIIEDIIAVCFDLGLSIGVVACDFHNRQPNFVDVWFSKFYEKYIAPAYPSPATVVHSVCEHPLYQYPEWFPTSPTDYGWQPRMYWATVPLCLLGMLVSGTSIIKKSGHTLNGEMNHQ